MEIAGLALRAARRHADEQFKINQGLPLITAIPKFKENFTRARSHARRGREYRSNMPVLDEGDLPEIKALLASCGPRAVEFCDVTTIPAVKLRPIQRQIYFDKSVDITAKNGIQSTRDWLLKRHIFTTYHGEILDGHHGWLSGMLIGPEDTSLLQFKMRMPLEDVLPFLRHFSDRHGRVRNQ